MATQAIFKTFLLFHITGLILFAGTILVEFVTFRQFWKQYHSDKPNMVVGLRLIRKFPVLMGIGFGIIILSGVGMMAITHGVFGEQLWFRIKFGIIIAIIIIRLAGRRQTKVLHNSLMNDEGDSSFKMHAVKRTLELSGYVQLALLLTILVLSIFKFT
jgi:uncharacterized membrane protein SirB2